MKTTLLIVEDEIAIRDMLRFSLQESSFDLIEAGDVKQAKLVLTEKLPDLILLDWMLPEQSGLDFIMWLRSHEVFNEIPIIMLTARADEASRVTGLLEGADDYVIKPFSPKELTARIKAVLRRRSTIVSPKETIRFKELVLDVQKNQLKIGETIIDLTLTEYKCLLFFLKNPNRTLTRDKLIAKVWGVSSEIDDRTVDVVMKRLRAKLKPFGYESLIKTIRGVGYQFTHP